MIDQKLVSMVEHMPPFPESAHRLIQMTSDIDCQPKDLIQAVGRDPVMTMKILKLVNSAYFALARHVSTLEHALVYLGMNTVKNLAISVATMSGLPTWNLQGFTTKGFLLHSVLTGRLAQLLTKRFGQGVDSSEAFVAGLLHDFGKAVFAHAASDEYTSVLYMAASESTALHAVEQRTFGFDHAQAGAMLADHWQLPDKLVHAIARHHSDREDIDMMISLVMVANALANRLVPGCSGNPVGTAIPAQLADRLGMDIEKLATDLGDLESEVDKTRALLA